MGFRHTQGLVKQMMMNQTEHFQTARSGIYILPKRGMIRQVVPLTCSIPIFKVSAIFGQ